MHGRQVGYTGKCLPDTLSRLVPYHIAIKMVAYPPRPRHTSISITNSQQRVGLIREPISVAFICNFRVAVVNISPPLLHKLLGYQISQLSLSRDFSPGEMGNDERGGRGEENVDKS